MTVTVRKFAANGNDENFETLYKSEVEQSGHVTQHPVFVKKSYIGVKHKHDFASKIYVFKGFLKIRDEHNQLVEARSGDVVEIDAETPHQELILTKFQGIWSTATKTEPNTNYDTPV